MGAHDGHRDRMRTRFIQNGLDGFTDVQILELLLFFAIPRRDTNEIAHRLLENFDSLSQVMEAPISELLKVDGIGETAAVLLKLIPAAGRAYQLDKTAHTKVLGTLEECAAFLRPHFFGRTSETVFLLCLDAKCNVTGCRSISEGDSSSAGVSVRKIVETALHTQAASVILSHNHPGGIALPSDEDLSLTASAAGALRAVGIVLADHMIFTDNEYYSMAVHGCLEHD